MMEYIIKTKRFRKKTKHWREAKQNDVFQRLIEADLALREMLMDRMPEELIQYQAKKVIRLRKKVRV
jgi:hypothetical protein